MHVAATLLMSKLRQLQHFCLIELNPAARYLLPNDSGNVAEQACS
jgi:hypothetical protein